jgi:hypothetical protein
MTRAAVSLLADVSETDKMNAPQPPQIDMKVHETDQEISPDNLREAARLYCRWVIREYRQQLEMRKGLNAESEVI